MDTNNNSRLEMDIQQEQADQLPQAQQMQHSGQAPTVKLENNQDNEDQNPDRIELYVKYDASDMLRDESETQTPIEDEPSRDNNDGNSTTLSLYNDNQQQQDDLNTSNNNTSDDLTNSNKTMVIQVQESEDENAESIEIELEDDKSLLLTSLTSLFPDATGLVFRHPVTNQRRAVKFADGKFVEPIEGWSFAKKYFCVFHRGAKRKTDDDLDVGKKARIETDKPAPSDGGSDLVVLGLPWTTTEETMRSYFEQYGEVVMVQVKTEKSGKSRGFGFVRFAKSSIQNKLIAMRHFIDGRWCDLRVPLSKAEADATKAAQLSRKIFVGRLPENITSDDLRNHFSEYGTLTDVFIPKPFRKFAFVTFGTSDMAQSIFKHKHVIKGTEVQISEAIPKDNAPNNIGGGFGAGFNAGPQLNAGSYGGGASYIGNANNNIHPFNNNYGAHQVPYHHHGKNNAVGNFGGGVYSNSRKMHQQSPYYQMPSFGSSGPGNSADSTSYANHGAHSDYAAFGGAGSYSQQSGGANGGGQYYKMQQQQPVMTSNQNHSTYPNQSSYSNHGANFSRNPYGSVWK